MFMNKNKMIGAPSVMKRRGEKTDTLVLQEIKNNPGSSIHEIADQLSWTNGRVDGSVNRLLLENKAKVKYVLKRGTLKKRIYPIDFIEKPANVIEIPKRIIEEGSWTNTVEIYALSRSTIALSPYRIEEYDKKAILRNQIPIMETDSTFEVILPNRFSEFYQLENSETGVSSIGEVALITVESTIPVDVPSTYSVETPSFDKYRLISGYEYEKASLIKKAMIVLTVEYDGISPIEGTWKKSESEQNTTDMGEWHPVEILKTKPILRVSSESMKMPAIKEIKVY